MPKKPKNYIGYVFDSLTVIGDAPARSNYSRYLYCQCVCGRVIKKNLSNLKKVIKSKKHCGCMDHGGTGTRLHSIWQNMKQRCYNPKHTNYRHYGEIGVIICNEWKNNFAAFRDWSMINGYSDNLSIDRIEGALIYSPSTCRWATQETQNRNQRLRKNTSSTYRGVCFFKRVGRWIAYITVSGKRKHLGYFNTEEEAAQTRDDYILQNGLTDFTLNKVNNVGHLTHTNQRSP